VGAVDPVAPRRSRIRRVLRVIKWVVLVFVGLLAIGIGAVTILVNTDWGRRQIKGIIVDNLEKSFPCGVKVGALEGNVLGDATVRDVVLTDCDQREAVKIARIELNLELTALVGGALRLEYLRVRGGAIQLHQAEGQPLNLLAMFKPSPDPLQWDIHVPIDATGIDVSVDVPGFVAHADQTSIQGTVDIAMTGPVDAKATIDTTWRERALAAHVEAAVGVRDGVVTVPAVVARLTDPAAGNATVAEVRGTDVRVEGEAELAAPLQVTIAQGALDRLLPPEPGAAPSGFVSPATELTIGVTRTGGGPLVAAATGTVAQTPVVAWASMPVETPVRVVGAVRTTDVDVRRFVPTAIATNVDDVAAVFALELVPTAEGGGTAGMLPVRGIVGFGARGGVAGGYHIDQLAAHLTLIPESVRGVVRADGPGAARLAVVGGVDLRDAGVLAIVPTRIIASATAIEQVAPVLGVSGAIEADLTVHGTIGPAPARKPIVLSANGQVIARGVRRERLRAARVELALHDLTIDVEQPAFARGDGTLTIAGGAVGLTPIPTTTLTVGAKGNGAADVRVQSQGGALVAGGAPWSVDVASTITPRDRFTAATIDLHSYMLSGGAASWSGAGGSIDASARKIVARGIRLGGAHGRLAIDGTFLPASGNVDAKVVLDDVDLAQADPLLGLSARGLPVKGRASVAVEVHKKGKAITGAIAGTVTGFVFRPEGQPIDAKVDATLGPTRVTGTIAASGGALGTVELGVDVARPTDLTDPAAWARLERDAIQTATVRATDLDLGPLAASLGITLPIDGTITAAAELGPASSKGEIHAHNLVIEGVPGLIDIDGTYEMATVGTVTVKATAALRGIALAVIEATVTVPRRPLDLAAWAALDLTAIKGAKVTLQEITIDDALANRLKIGNVRGRVAATVTIAEAVREVQAAVVARGMTGGPVRSPVDITVDATLDSRGAHAKVSAAVERVEVFNTEISAPIDPEVLATGGFAAIENVPITGKGTLLETQIAPLVQRFGQAIRIQGTISGHGEVAGTIGDPTAKGQLVIKDLGSRRQKVGATIDLGFAKGVIDAKLAAKSATGGALTATGKVNLRKVEEATIELTSSKFQISPLVRLIPDVVGVRGVVDGTMKLRGLDPRTAIAEGKLTITEAQIPIADAVGALTDGTVVLEMTANTAKLTAKGSIEAGTAELTASTTLVGILPKHGTLDVKLRELSIISTLQPQIQSANLHASVVMNANRWVVNAKVTGTRVEIPDDEGKPLHPAGPPTDMAFLENGELRQTTKAALVTLIGKIPTAPYLIVKVQIDPVDITSKQLRGIVYGNLELTIGSDGLLLEGTIEARRGEVMVFDRRYNLQRATVTFLGDLDPQLDLALSHEFTELTLQVTIKGRLSNPDLYFTPVPGYTQGQLLGFLLGGTPGGPTNDTREALTGAATAVASQAVGGFITKKLPVKIDVLRYESESTSSSAAFVIGRWITDRILLLLRTRTQAREDENTAESEVEFWLGRRIILDVVGGNRGVVGADLLWTRRW
jgi:hypothetical protein